MIRSLAGSFSSKAARTLVASASIFALASGFSAATTTPADAQDFFSMSGTANNTVMVAAAATQLTEGRARKEEAAEPQPVTAKEMLSFAAVFTLLMGAFYVTDNYDARALRKARPPNNSPGSDPKA
jgi:hypothetical protein